MRKAILAFVILGSMVNGSAFAQSAADVQESVDNLSDVLAKDIATRWKWKGDFRLRNENIDQEYAAGRNRDRIRVRMSAVAQVNDTIKAEVGFTTTENGDARSGNQTLSDVNSKKAIDLDLAYVEWQPNALAKVTLGKMKYPWVTTSSYFFDKDVNPEGAAVALNHAPTGIFANVFVADLVERSTAADSRMIGYQVGMKNRLTDDSNLTTAVGYFDHRFVMNYGVTQSSSAGGVFGNTTKTTGCVVVTTCLANDYDVINALAELNTKVAGFPVTAIVDWAKNDKAAKFETALAYGVTVGKASLPGSWEVGYLHQKVQKDALFGQWVDSDFGGGSTESQGHVFRGAYQIAKGWKVNATYFMNETNIDVATTVALGNNVFTAVKGRGYDRLQLDLNYAF